MDSKKLLKKTAALLFTGLMCASLLSPLLHETGHLIALLCFDCDVMEISFFPLPSLLCSRDGLSSVQLVVIGLSGTFFPALISLFLFPKRFLLKYAIFIFRLINVYCVCLNLFYCISFSTGLAVNENDISVILSAKPEALPFVVCSHLFILTILLLFLKHTFSFSDFENYFQEKSAPEIILRRAK